MWLEDVHFLGTLLFVLMELSTRLSKRGGGDLSQEPIPARIAPSAGKEVVFLLPTKQRQSRAVGMEARWLSPLLQEGCSPFYGRASLGYVGRIKT